MIWSCPFPRALWAEPLAARASRASASTPFRTARLPALPAPTARSPLFVSRELRETVPTEPEDEPPQFSNVEEDLTRAYRRLRVPVNQSKVGFETL